MIGGKVNIALLREIDKRNKRREYESRAAIIPSPTPTPISPSIPPVPPKERNPVKMLDRQTRRLKMIAIAEKKEKFYQEHGYSGKIFDKALYVHSKVLPRESILKKLDRLRREGRHENT